MNNRQAVCTIVANNYLASAKVLGESLKNQNVDFYVLLVDDKLETLNYAEMDFVLIESKVLFNEELFNEMAYKYDVIEFSTALKPFFMEYLFNEYNYEKLFYIDPDIYVFCDFDEISKELGDYTAMLTPHIVEPCKQLTHIELEESFMRFGIYNLGFIGINNTSAGRDLLKWWQVRLREYCYNDQIYFVDQKWMNYLPAVFDNIYVCRKKSYNVSHWNFFERSIYKDNDRFMTGDGELCFFHFSNYKAEEPQKHVAKKFGNVSDDEREVLLELYSFYQQCLIENGFQLYSAQKYKYNYYENGMAVTRLQRRIYRGLLLEGHKYKNPFSVSKDTFYDLLNRNKLLVKTTGEKKEAQQRIGETGKRRGNRIHIMNSFLRFLKTIIGVRRYEKLIYYFSDYCSINDQIFLIKKER